MLTIKSAEEFKATIGQDKITVVDFFATWCGPCKIIAPRFEEWSKKYTNATFCKVDVDELGDVAADADVSAMPTFNVYRAGELLEQVVGADAKKLEACIKARCA
ncbi:hypothetical protein CXG81DRAFT_17855 [Caulochytrium protostelioides]|uniref:Thioredoxin n=1 Tax=Caulochytrium protostelioides TaxID=1555241 RepID=A0A4P9XAT3_9FUNG|nr:hypothetical protein CXG81DRAFT_17855 [Caulochytrium protostelioides]|eukprot:RKP02493.1 hypothetical protein CXG81DRAFT_17855 [Caulochytrium protostelioides]